MYMYMYMYVCVHIYIYIYIYTHICIHRIAIHIHIAIVWLCYDNVELRPVHLLMVSLLRVLESNFPGDSLSNYMDMRIPTP